MNLKFPVNQMIVENDPHQFSHPAFIRKVPKEITPVDFDEVQQLIELEFSDGFRKWECFSTFFGKVIKDAEYLEIILKNGTINTLKIVGIKVEKIKRTLYWRLIFETDLPF